ncbi:MAG: hypothetical protein JXX29_04770 [Deltaproteobacteria bacterium]|nr:hypothetical protein [Deltaproteobacteria bacterium]MBN2670959.1 hypothetical protein [Deltaproteobacteria bacterium]
MMFSKTKIVCLIVTGLLCACQAILEKEYHIVTDSDSISDTSNDSDSGTDSESDPDEHDTTSDSMVDTETGSDSLSAPGEIILYATDNVPNSLEGSRSAARSVCRDAANAFFGENHTYHIEMFISMSAEDTIALMPQTFGFSHESRVVGPNTVEIASSWTDLFSGDLSATLMEANVTGGETDTYPYWWSGSNSSGGLASACSGWTITDDTQNATLGALDSYGPSWLTSDTTSCDGWWRFLCIAFEE